MKNDKITRKEALHKLGKYAAITSASTFMILHPKTAQAFSNQPPSVNKNNPW